ncbi:hypothetical protein Pth03_70720 [Planotetraspora thailandica]|uniref:Uncharacterized protein n=1 Tax=Planotetraspora thailandica TaxID=487172 RepID=A0A8J3Y0P9_9ACTN|nr:hypothetical protein [Planotetraspora thailandica]GII58683.1 hypothetical protein Pth03_70720 [Planotetraspora thailandica]
MLDQFTQQIAGSFPRRFLFNALLPTFVFVSLTTSLVAASLTTFVQLSTWWAGLDAITKIIVLLGYLATVWFLAAAVSSQWRGIVRLYEGYPLRRLSAHLGCENVPGVRWHAERMRDLLNDLDGSEPDTVTAYYRYPNKEENVFPTRLGNVLQAAESYPRDRYGIDTIIFWPRLFALLPEQFQRDYEEYVANYEFPLVVSFQASLATTISGVTLLLTGQSPLLYILVVGGGYISAYASYRFALSGAEELGEQQRTAFDLYRDRLLETWPTPEDVRDERDAFKTITRFVVIGGSPGWSHGQSRHRSRRAGDSRAGVGPQTNDGDAVGAQGP